MLLEELGIFILKKKKQQTNPQEPTHKPHTLYKNELKMIIHLSVKCKYLRLLE